MTDAQGPIDAGGPAAAAFAHLRANREGITAVQIELSEIAAPTGAEPDRAEVVSRWLHAAGCLVRRDEAGNVIAERPGRGGGPRVALSAHLDTVFPVEQALSVARPGEACPYCGAAAVPAGELHGPGIADDAAGLAGLIGLAQALAAAETGTAGDLIFLATVGEEGRGNLRGARHFFADAASGPIDAFITIDHPEPEAIVHRGVGSRRFVVEMQGPGGHAWADFGRYNPAQAMAGAVQRFADTRLPRRPRATTNVGVIEAGRSVNAIPKEARMEVEVRSESDEHLERLEASLRRAVEEAQAEELARRGIDTDQAHGIAVSIESMGKRPGGATAANHPLVLAAAQALKAEGFAPRFTASSTDANAAMAAGIPAIALGWGGRSGELHSRREYFAPAGRERTLAALLRLLLELSGPATRA